MSECGISAVNINKIAMETGASEFHISVRSAIEGCMVYRNFKVYMGGMVKIEEYMRDVFDPEKIKVVLAELS